MAKIRPLMDTLCQKFQQWGYMHEKLSIDEAMIKYFGSHSSKQFIRGKPIRFGFKNWMLTSSCGYLYSFDTYCGAKNVEPTKKTLPLGSRVVLDLLETVEHPTDHIIYCDNYFTSHDLFSLLKTKGFRATGTARENRIKKCPLKSSKDFKRESRGYFEYKYDTSNGLVFVKWNDNSVVTLCSNFDTIKPLHFVKRWSAVEKKKISIQQPKMIADYNLGMGGVDLHDQAVNAYKIKIRGKKWWWPIFTFMLNSTLVNAWKLYKAVTNSSEDLLSFQRAVARHYLRNYTVKKNSKLSVLPSIATTAGAHFPKRIGNPRRCRECHQRIRWICEQCDIALCVERECFKKAHSKN